jgi:hypothetical protein
MAFVNLVQQEFTVCFVIVTCPLAEFSRHSLTPFGRILLGTLAASFQRMPLEPQSGEISEAKEPFECFVKLQASSQPVYVVRFNKAGSHIFTAGQDRSIHLWNPFRDVDRSATVPPAVQKDDDLGLFGSNFIFSCDFICPVTSRYRKMVP